jgi:hypothetical protein
MTRRPPGATRFILDNSLLLLGGTVAAIAWANINHDTYDRLAHPLHFWVNDVGIVFFFALAAKEGFEATLPGGSLASPRRALSPLLWRSACRARCVGLRGERARDASCGDSVAGRVVPLARRGMQKGRDYGSAGARRRRTLA